MSTINSIGLNSTVVTNSQTTASQQADSISSSVNSTSLQTKTTDATSNVEISTRAQKIQALNEEFLSGGPQSLVITTEFIERLEEYGFITSEQATNFATTLSDDDTEDHQTVSGLSNFLEDYIDKITQSDSANNTLIEALQNAQTVLDNFNTPNEQSKSINIVQVSQQLKNHIAGANGQLSESEKQALTQVTSALDIANVLTPGKNNTAQINSYLSLS